MFKNCVLKVSVDTQKWVKSATVRAIKTMAQTAVSVIAVGSTVANVDWKLQKSYWAPGRPYSPTAPPSAQQ